MTTTRSGLTAATLTSLTGGIMVNCMFNPEHYTIKKTNKWSGDSQNKSGEGPKLVKPPKPEFEQYGRSTLTLSTLYFDTYESTNGASLTDITNKLWDLMRPIDSSDPKSVPPEVKFEWASFHFVAVITDMTVKYTLFDKDGNPVRAEVTISFMQSEDPTDYPHQNPSSGGEAVQEIRQVVTGDRLDLIAMEVYGDSTEWRRIAEYNGISKPLALRPGQMIKIPLK